MLFRRFGAKTSFVRLAKSFLSSRHTLVKFGRIPSLPGHHRPHNMPPSKPSRVDDPPYTLPSYFAKYHDSPHRWDEIAYLEHLFPDGVQLTRLKHQNALNRWIGAIKWLQENSEHAQQAIKLLGQYSEEV